MRHHPPGLWRRLGKESGNNQSDRVGISRGEVCAPFPVMAGLVPAIQAQRRHLDLYTNTIYFRLNRIRDLTGSIRGGMQGCC